MAYAAGHELCVKVVSKLSSVCRSEKLDIVKTPGRALTGKAGRWKGDVPAPGNPCLS